MGQLSERTSIRLGVAITVATAICGAIVWLNMRLSSIDYRLAELSVSVKDLWTWRNQRDYMRLMEEMNKSTLPTLRIPSVDPPR